MEQADRDSIQRNIVRLSSLVNLEPLYRELIGRGVIDQVFIERIKADYKVPTEQGQEFFLSYTKRGPQAFQILLESLEKSGHVSEANLLRSRSGLSPAKTESVQNGNETSSTPTRPGSNTTPKGATHNGQIPSLQSSSSSPSSSANNSVPGSPFMRHHISRVEPLSENTSPTNSTSSLSASEQLQFALTSVSLEEPLIVRVRPAEQYNMGVHEAYQMMSRPRGYALIVNNIEFIGDPQAKRDGAEKDTIHLQQLLEQFGFEVMVRHNVNKKELLDPSTGIIRKFLDQFRRPAGQTADACIVALMSHGKENQIRSHDPEDPRHPSANYWHFNEEILKEFNNRYCPFLVGKPKVFIVQACQGNKHDRGVRRTQTDAGDLTRSENQVSHSSSEGDWMPDAPQDIPETEDIIICHSTVPGFVSNRDIEHGTWYIRTLVQVWMEFAWNTEISGLLRKVGKAMRSIKSEYGSKQMSSYTVMGLHNELYFNPGLYVDTNNSTWNDVRSPHLTSGILEQRNSEDAGDENEDITSY